EVCCVSNLTSQISLLLKAEPVEAGRDWSVTRHQALRITSLWRHQLAAAAVFLSVPPRASVSG
ncbi:MAG: hypothetical protein ACK5XL_11105, partial [Cyclobacteriaceae bacterium]